MANTTHPEIRIPIQINRAPRRQRIALVRPRAFDRTSLVYLDPAARVEPEIRAIRPFDHGRVVSIAVSRAGARVRVGGTRQAHEAETEEEDGENTPDEGLPGQKNHLVSRVLSVIKTR